MSANHNCLKGMASTQTPIEMAAAVADKAAKCIERECGWPVSVVAVEAAQGVFTAVLQFGPVEEPPPAVLIEAAQVPAGEVSGS